jgi:hypothetical protein
MSISPISSSTIAVALCARTEGVARSEVKAYVAQREKADEWTKNVARQVLEYLQGDSIVTKTKKRAPAEVSDYWERASEWLDTAPYGPAYGPPIVTVVSTADGRAGIRFAQSGLPSKFTNASSFIAAFSTTEEP